MPSRLSIEGFNNRKMFLIYSRRMFLFGDIYVQQIVYNRFRDDYHYKINQPFGSAFMIVIQNRHLRINCIIAYK